MARSRRPARHRRVRETAATEYAPARPAEIAGILLDSNVIIEALRGRPLVLDELRAIDRRGVPTYCCPVGWAEIFAGIRPGEEAAAEAFFAARRGLVIDAGAGRRAGHYPARYARSHGLEMPDALVAASASLVGLRLWTLNRRHYPMDDVTFYEPAGP